MCAVMVSHDVEEAAMESTATYWVPVWDTNPHHNGMDKPIMYLSLVSGNKTSSIGGTDKLDGLYFLEES